MQTIYYYYNVSITLFCKLIQKAYTYSMTVISRVRQLQTMNNNFSFCLFSIIHVIHHSSKGFSLKFGFFIFNICLILIAKISGIQIILQKNILSQPQTISTIPVQRIRDVQNYTAVSSFFYLRPQTISFYMYYSRSDK